MRARSTISYEFFVASKARVSDGGVTENNKLMCPGCGQRCYTIHWWGILEPEAVEITALHQRANQRKACQCVQ